MGFSTLLFTVISVARSYFIRRFFDNNLGRFILYIFWQKQKKKKLD